MRLILTWIDQLRRTTAEQLPAFCAALVAQLQEIIFAANAWADHDHNTDGSHAVIQFTEETNTPTAVATAIKVWYDGTNLKYLKPDGTTGNIV